MHLHKDQEIIPAFRLDRFNVHQMMQEKGMSTNMLLRSYFPLHLCLQSVALSNQELGHQKYHLTNNKRKFKACTNKHNPTPSAFRRSHNPFFMHPKRTVRKAKERIQYK